MRRFIFLLLILMVAVWLGLQIAKDPGLAFFSYRQWSVEMPLWFAVFGLMTLLFLFYLLWSVLSRIDHFFYRWSTWLRWRRKNKAYSKTHRGLLELIEGRFRKAEHYLLAGLSQSDAPLINYLALAKAAHEQAAYNRQETYLRSAYAATTSEEIVIGITQAQFQIDQGQFEQALATLNHLQAIAPQHGLVLKLLERVYVHLADWKNVLALLPRLYQAKIITREQCTLLEIKTYAELLQSTAYHPESAASIHAVWHSIPKKIQKTPQLLGCYARQLLCYPDEAAEVVTLLSRSLKKSWDSELITLYGLLDTGDSIKQLAQAENWLTCYPNQALLFLTLGRLSVRCQLWGKARHYFEESLKLEKSAIVYLEYGKLLDQLGEPSTAYQEGLALLLR